MAAHEPFLNCGESLISFRAASPAGPAPITQICCWWFLQDASSASNPCEPQIRNETHGRYVDAIYLEENPWRLKQSREQCAKPWWWWQRYKGYDDADTCEMTSSGICRNGIVTEIDTIKEFRRAV